MNRIAQIKDCPTKLTAHEVQEQLQGMHPPVAWHESLLRSYATLEYVKELLEMDTSPEVVLEIISEIYRTDKVRELNPTGNGAKASGFGRPVKESRNAV